MARYSTSYKSYTIPIALAIVVEVIVLLVLFYNWSNKSNTEPTKPPIVATLYALQSESKAEKPTPPALKVTPEKQILPKRNVPPELKVLPKKQTPPQEKLRPEEKVSPDADKINVDQDKLLKQLLSNNDNNPPPGDKLSNQVVGRIDDLVRQRIQKNWTELGNPLPGSQVELLIEMSPNGTIMNVLVSHSSGNIDFDNSAVTAARNVGRIPEVQQLDTNTFNQLYRKRAFIFTAKGL